MEAIPGTEFVYGSGLSRTYGVAKLTWLVSENHTLSGSFNTQPTVEGGRFGVNGAPAATYATSTYNTTNVVVGYGGKLLDKHLLLEANLGWFEAPSRPRTKTINGVDQALAPLISWRTLQPLQNFDPSVAASCPYESRQEGNRRRAWLLRPVLRDGRSGRIRGEHHPTIRRDGLGDGALRSPGPAHAEGRRTDRLRRVQWNPGLLRRLVLLGLRRVPRAGYRRNRRGLRHLPDDHQRTGRSRQRPSPGPARRSTPTGARASWMDSA